MRCYITQHQYYIMTIQRGLKFKKKWIVIRSMFYSLLVWCKNIQVCYFWTEEVCEKNTSVWMSLRLIIHINIEYIGSKVCIVKTTEIPRWMMFSVKINASRWGIIQRLWDLCCSVHRLLDARGQLIELYGDARPTSWSWCTHNCR